MSDPLLKTGPETQRELFKVFGKEASKGYSAEDAIGAALNIIVNAIRQTNPTKDKALLKSDELMEKARQLVSAQYVGSTRLQGAYVFDQTIQVPLLDDRARVIKIN